VEGGGSRLLHLLFPYYLLRLCCFPTDYMNVSIRFTG